MKALKINKREAGALVAGLLWCSCSFKLGKSQISLLRKVWKLYPDLYKPELWAEIKGEESAEGV